MSLARALVREAPVLLLDEPTSALDTRTAAEVVDSVFAAGGVLPVGRPTTLVVTHSLALIKRCDKVAVLSAEGRIVQAGTFDALAAESSGPFAQILHAGELLDDTSR
uniref:ABC transporter domain-containing protein n=1 Tax=Zooxanthella nutricula TaxID=1333877 RepID=A0A7S2QJA6_9DINO